MLPLTRMPSDGCLQMVLNALLDCAMNCPRNCYEHKEWQECNALRTKSEAFCFCAYIFNPIFLAFPTTLPPLQPPSLPSVLSLSLPEVDLSQTPDPPASIPPTHQELHGHFLKVSSFPVFCMSSSVSPVCPCPVMCHGHLPPFQGFSKAS